MPTGKIKARPRSIGFFSIPERYVSPYAIVERLGQAVARALLGSGR